MTIIIIGGGLSGTLTAANLLRLAQQPLHVVLVERSPLLGRGVAYGTDCSAHLLNVPAASLSVWPDEPAHFLKWLADHAGRPGFPTAPVSPAAFLPRNLFGEYIADVLREARAAAPAHITLEVVAGEATDLEEVDGRCRLTLNNGSTLKADRVVLALGNLPGEYPIKRALPFYHGPRYVHVPWRAGALDSIRSQDDILIVGAGLTAVDIIIQLNHGGHRGRIHALSRRGLNPQVHKAGLPAYPDFLIGETLPTTIGGIVRRIRREIDTAAAAGIDWRAVINAIRPRTQALWQNLSWDERARFMRHVRPHWEIHRHRIAPEVAGTLEKIRAEGRLEFYAGRLQSLRETADAAEAVFRRRGTDVLHTFRVAKVINCTGPRTDYSKYQHPLLINLLARSLIDHDPLALGINALPNGQVLSYRGGPVPWLFTLGAPLKGVLWETTAVPEIRAQAAALSRALLQREGTS